MTPPATAVSDSRIDKLFREYVDKLPEPASLSESNGASLECGKRGYVTYTLLRGLAERLGVEADAELVQLVPWARHEDACIRQIAIEAIITRIQFDRDRLSAPGMHEPDDHVFHDIFVSLRAFLVARQVAMPPQLFAGMFLDITSKDFAGLQGTWQEVSSDQKNFQTTVTLDGDLVRVMQRRVEPDPGWPDHTWTTKILDVTVNERRQFVVRGEWSAESDATGYRGPQNRPGQFTYLFWPVSADVVWFDEGRDSWNQLRRAQPRK